MSITPSFLGQRLPGRALVGLLLLLAAAPSFGAKPYVENQPPRGLHLFNRPREKTPEKQWAFVQSLDQAGKTRAASRQALALRLFWPHSPEAPAAQLLLARALERRGNLQEAFDAYQHLVDHYPGRFEFNAVLDRQMDLAKSVMELRKGKFLFVPGFDAPERAIPLFEKIVAGAPEWSGAAEAYYRIGLAHQRVFEHALAIDAFFTVLNRFPGGEFAEPAAFQQVKSHVELSRESPQDNRAVETALAACDLFLLRFSDSSRRPEIESLRQSLRAELARIAFSRAEYYDRVLRNPESALMEYRTFIGLYPDAAQAPEARARVERLVQQREKKQ